jgi:hypothetical protein
LGVAITIYTVVVSLDDIGNEDVASDDIGNEDVASNIDTRSLETRPNIYFLWQDAMETGYMKKYLSGSSASDAFSGFTLFENNSANYPYTMQSYASFMPGTLFSGENYDDWSKGRDLLRQTLRNEGYKVTTYAKKDFLSPLDDVAKSSDEIHAKWSSVKHPYVSDYIGYWFVRSLPSVIANYSLIVGKALGVALHDSVNPVSTYSNVRTIKDGIEPLTGVFTLEELIVDEDSRADNNEFVIAQAIIPHGPYVIDKKCQYRGAAMDGRSAAYYDQVVCASDKVKVFFNKLKSLERYDSSLILVMGDYGAGWADLIDAKEANSKPLNSKYMPWSKSMMISRASALLMFKPPESGLDRKLSYSKRESQLVDIYPTVMSLATGKPEYAQTIDEINLYGDKVVQRKKQLFHFKPAKVLNKYDTEVYDLEYSPTGGLVDISFHSLLHEAEAALADVVCEKNIMFSSHSNDDKYYFSTGTSGREAWGTWSEGSIANIDFKLPKVGCEKSQAVFRLRWFVTHEHAEQSVKVYLNGSMIDEFSVMYGEETPQEYTLDLPPKVLEYGAKNALEFHVRKPVSPKSIGVNSDNRLLGVGFESMVFL